MSITKIRIFVSSPGDVQEERDIARGVVQQLGRTFAGRLQLQATSRIAVLFGTRFIGPWIDSTFGGS